VAYRIRRAKCRSTIESLESRVLLSATAGLNRLLHPTFHLSHHSGAHPNATAGPTGITPAQMRQAYGVNGIRFGGITADGSGQTIAIIDAYDDPNIAGDLSAFDSAFGLAAPPSFTKVNEDGGASLPGVDNIDTKPNTWELEEALDVEWAHVIAPAASIILYEANSSSFNDLVVHAVNAARNNVNVSVVSMSFSGGEFSGETGYDGYFTRPAGHQGVTFLASTGDTGSPGGYPAYSPNVVSVGGTQLSIDSSGNRTSETGWSGSGGGNSSQEPEPSYQTSVQSSGARSTPDVSLDASPSSGVPVYDSYDNGTFNPWSQVGGTSLSTPMWAGLIAIANQGRAVNGLGSLNGATQTLPMLYQAASTGFNDITSGGNGGFSAGAGYDRVTGLGTPIANQLVPILAGSPAAPVNATVFNSSSAPAAGVQNIYDPGIVTAGGVELGMKFHSDTSGYITGVRFFKGAQAGGAQTGELWTSSGQLLATATFTSETTSGWQQVNFNQPVAINANTTYIVSYHTTSGYIAYTTGGLASAIDNGPLHAPSSSSSGGNDVYVYGASAFPGVYNGQSPNYWVDAVFSTTGGSGTTATLSSIYAASFAPSGPPGFDNTYDGGIAAAGGVELGEKFRSDVAGTVTAIRFYKGSQDSGIQRGELWSSTGQLLASATFTSESAAGWQQVNLSTPVAISANTTYIVAYHSTSPFIVYTPNALASAGVDNAPLHLLQSGLDGGNSVYAYDASPGASSFPGTYNGQSANYWVDVVLSH